MKKKTEDWGKYRKNYVKERYHYLKKLRLCVECGYEKALPNLTRCKTCKEKLKQRLINYRLRNIENGVCSNCGKEKETDRVLCNKCIEVNKKSKEAYYKRQKEKKQCK